jgi:hypothetical protein
MQIPFDLHVNSNSEQVDDNDEVDGVSAVEERRWGTRQKGICNENENYGSRKSEGENNEELRFRVSQFSAARTENSLLLFGEREFELSSLCLDGDEWGAG